MYMQIASTSYAHSYDVSNGARRVPFALCNDGLIRHISEINDKLFAPFTCADCGEEVRLRAVHSDKVSKHFYHSNNNRCSGETALHLYAKRILSEYKYLCFPHITALVDYCTMRIKESEMKFFDIVDIEVNVGPRRVDALCIGDSVEYAIEFAVYHRVDESKSQSLTNVGLATLEIDLGYPANAPTDIAELNAYILEKSKRRWIYHPLSAEYISNNQKEAAPKIGHRVHRLEPDHHITAFEVEQISRKIELYRTQNSRSHRECLAIDDVQTFGLGNCLGIEVPGSTLFNIDAEAWQAIFIRKAIIENQSLFELLDESEWILRGHKLDTRFLDCYINKQIQESLSLCRPKTLAAMGIPTTAEEVVRLYVERISGYHRNLRINSAISLIHMTGDLADRKTRYIYIRNRVFSLLDMVGLAERAWQIWHDWLSKPYLNRKSVYSFINESYECFEQISNNLKQYMAMSLNDELCSEKNDFMGLPLSGLNDPKAKLRSKSQSKLQKQVNVAVAAEERRIAERRKNDRRDMDTRAFDFKRYVQLSLGADADNFLGSFDTASNMVISSASRFADHNRRLRSVVDSLVERNNKAKIVAESKPAMECRLTQAAIKQFEREVDAQKWLNTPDWLLNNRTPLECVNSTNFSTIAALLIGRS